LSDQRKNDRRSLPCDTAYNFDPRQIQALVGEPAAVAANTPASAPAAPATPAAINHSRKAVLVLPVYTTAVR